MCTFLCTCQIIYPSTGFSKAFKDPRDGERYQYVAIDNIYWMTSNMRYNVKGSKLNPDNPSPLYGKLYTWEQAIKACPKGWELSTDLDWLSLEQYVTYLSLIHI